MPQTDLESDPVLFICPAKASPGLCLLFPAHQNIAFMPQPLPISHFITFFLQPRFPTLVGPEGRLIPKSQRCWRSQARGYPLLTLPRGEGC